MGVKTPKKYKEIHLYVCAIIMMIDIIKRSGRAHQQPQADK